MSEIKILGIDMGITGGFVMICGDEVLSYKTPTLTESQYQKSTTKKPVPNTIRAKKMIDIAGVIELIESLNPDVIVMEEQFIPHDKIQSGMTTNIFNWGLIYGIACTTDAEIISVPAKTWQASYVFTLTGKKTKKDHVILCNRDFGAEYKFAEDGMADARLIAEWYKRKLNAMAEFNRRRGL